MNNHLPHCNSGWRGGQCFDVQQPAAGQLDAQITTNAAAIAANALLQRQPRRRLSRRDLLIPASNARLDFMDTVAQLAGGNVGTKANGVLAAGQKVLTVDATTGFVVNSPIVYLLNGTTLEGNTIASIQAGVSLTLGTSIGPTPAGSMLSDTLYQHDLTQRVTLLRRRSRTPGTLMLPQTMEYPNGGVYNADAYALASDASDSEAIDRASKAPRRRRAVDG